MNFEEGVTHLTKTCHHMLDEAEKLFGKRESDWTFIGLEFKDGGPYICYYPNNKISIVLSKGCTKLIPSHPQFYFQLAHEVCHLLYPTGKNDANLLNEGISTYFSEVYVNSMFPGTTYAIDAISITNYYEPYLLVKKMLSVEPNAITKIRTINKNISKVTPEQLGSLKLDIEQSDILKLCSKFAV